MKYVLDRFLDDCSPLKIELNNKGFCCTKTQFRAHKSHHSNNNQARQTMSSSLHCHQDCPARRAPMPTPEKACRPPTSNFPPLQRQWLQARGGRSLCPPSPGRYCEQWPTLRRRRDGRLPFGRSLQLLSSSSSGCSSSNKGRCPPHHHWYPNTPSRVRMFRIWAKYDTGCSSGRSKTATTLTGITGFNSRYYIFDSQTRKWAFLVIT